MKHILYSLFALAIFSFGFSSCGNKSKGKNNVDSSEVVDKTGKEYTSVYVCPMHCKNSGSEKAGVCPVCGMDYVVNKEHKHKGHNHDGHNHDHDGHDHGNHDGHNHGDHEGHNH